MIITGCNWLHLGRLARWWVPVLLLRITFKWLIYYFFLLELIKIIHEKLLSSHNCITEHPGNKKSTKIGWMGQVRHVNNDLQIRKGGVGVPWQSPSSQLHCSSSILFQYFRRYYLDLQTFKQHPEVLLAKAKILNRYCKY